MASYLRQLAIQWGRTIFGPALAVIGLVAEWTGRLDEFPVGPYVVNVWFFGAVLALLWAQYVLWRAEQNASQSLRGVADMPLVPRAHPSTAEVDAYRSARDKKSRGERLSRKERKVLTRTDLGVTGRSFVENLSYRLDIGRQYPSLIESSGVKSQKELDDYVATKPSYEKLSSWLASRLQDDTLDKAKGWETSVSDSLEEYLGHTYVARFRSDAGLTPATPPSRLKDGHHVRAWKHHEMRLQRLHEIIQDLSAKWNI